ncbi:hypothetical protein H5410_048806 [Solanum commersonii]|uniref:Uncharacterized protein n=1 Tax=Solanum commersonii TaxID=4109 RepID=A0A9J5XM29_SOLCO|nr:hypothetical protein H5410_048806 [Solanum commersonii]
MGLLTHKLERREIASGDHIYIWKIVFTYSHHGYFVDLLEMSLISENVGQHFVVSSRSTGKLFNASMICVITKGCSLMLTTSIIMALTCVEEGGSPNVDELFFLDMWQELGFQDEMDLRLEINKIDLFICEAQNNYSTQMTMN